jgi:hypothetical protein
MHDPSVRRETAATTTDDLATDGNVMMISSPVEAEEKKAQREDEEDVVSCLGEKISENQSNQFNPLSQPGCQPTPERRKTKFWWWPLQEGGSLPGNILGRWVLSSGRLGTWLQAG